VSEGIDLSCGCGNYPRLDGFFPCNEDGNEIEPTIGSGWAGLYVCGRCGNITDLSITKGVVVR
jgi:hypothetical protein